jgi:hypothetical protein
VVLHRSEVGADLGKILTYIAREVICCEEIDENRITAGPIEVHEENAGDGEAGGFEDICLDGEIPDVLDLGARRRLDFDEVERGIEPKDEDVGADDAVVGEKAGLVDDRSPSSKGGLSGLEGVGPLHGVFIQEKATREALACNTANSMALGEDALLGWGDRRDEVAAMGFEP